MGDETPDRLDGGQPAQTGLTERRTRGGKTPMDKSGWNFEGRVARGRRDADPDGLSSGQLTASGPRPPPGPCGPDRR